MKRLFNFGHKLMNMGTNDLFSMWPFHVSKEEVNFCLENISVFYNILTQHREIANIHQELIPAHNTFQWEASFPASCPTTKLEMINHCLTF